MSTATYLADPGFRPDTHDLLARRAVGAALASLIFLVSAGCGGPNAAAGTVVRDSAGVAIVENYAAAWDESSQWRVSAEPVLRIGTVEGGDPAERFTNIRGLARLSDGRIVVLDGGSNEVRWFSPEGVHLATRGGRGRGPGEFNAAWSLHVTSGDTVFVEDAPVPKHVFYAPDAELVREEAIDNERRGQLGPWAECLRMTLPDRSRLECRAEPGLEYATEVRPGYLRNFARFVLLPWSLEAEHPLGIYGGIEQWGVLAPDGRVRFGVSPFNSRTAAAGGGDPLRIVIALNPDYSIEVWTPDGRLDRIIRRSSAQHALTAQDREYERETMLVTSRDEALRDRMLAEMTLPTVAPAVLDITIGVQNELWVARAPSIHYPNDFDVFDENGVFLGVVGLPSRFGIFEAGSDYLLGVRTDDNDVPFIEMYALDRRD